MSGATSIVASLSRGLPMVLVAMIPGIAHANDPRRGMNDFPCSPTLLITLPMMNAARAMYPVSSRRPRKKKRKSIWGRKVTTAATPAIPPWMIRSRRSPGGMATSTRAPSASNPCLIRSIGSWAQENIAWNTRAIRARNITTPHTRCVRTASILSLRLIPCAEFRVTDCKQTDLIQAYRDSTKTECLSNPRKSSFSWSRLTWAITSGAYRSILSRRALSVVRSFIASCRAFRGEIWWTS